MAPRLSREAEELDLLAVAARETGAAFQQAAVTIQPGWLDEDPPTWEWEHDPDYLSLRQRAIALRWVESWTAFVNDPNTRFARFVSTGSWEARQ